MNDLVFSYPGDRCPNCHSMLKIYRVDHRTVKTEYGSYHVIHRIKYCPLDSIRFRSDLLDGIIPPKCTYSNSVMVMAAMDRFISGMSSSEISSAIGISEGHARKITNLALEIFHKIHEDALPKLREYASPYILQIDGTTDSAFEMIIVVRDAVSDFVLHATKCVSESQESIERVLIAIRDRFGSPSGITCDMRSGIISAAEKVFPGIPVRICLMHFLRDLGKDLMDDMHTDLGRMINRAGIKSSLKDILRGIPDYSQETLDQIDQGFCQDQEKIVIMSIRGILQDLILSTGSSGYGFPFSLKHLNFFVSCDDSYRKLSDILGVAKDGESSRMIRDIMNRIGRITENIAIRELASKIRDINTMIFQRIRKAFMIGERGNLSDDRYDPGKYDNIVHERCNILFGELEVYLHAGIADHIFQAAKISIQRYRKREKMLFAQNDDGTIPRTNNGMERFFRKIRRNVRKRSGNIATGNVLAQSGEALALFQNMDNAEYRRIVFGNKDIGSVFGKYRKPFRKNGFTKKKTMALVKKGMEMLLNNSLDSNPYSGEMLDKYYELYKNS